MIALCYNILAVGFGYPESLQGEVGWGGGCGGGGGLLTAVVGSEQLREP